MSEPEDAEIIAELTRTRSLVKDFFEWLKLAPSDLSLRPPSIDELGKTLQGILERHRVFKTDAQVYFGPKQLHRHPYIAARKLLAVAHERTAEAALDWLYKVYTTNVADLRYVSEVLGVSPEVPFTFSNGVRLCRLSDVPSSPMNDAIQARYRTLLEHAEWFGPPVVALYEVRAVGATATYGGPHHSREIERAVRALVLADPHMAPVLGTRWEDLTDPELELFSYGRMWSGARFEGTAPQIQQKLDVEGISRAEAILRTKGQTGDVLDLAAERLILARRRSSPSNQAIEGSICLEALLLADTDASEINYRLALRAALLLEESHDKRRQLRRSAKDFYGLRSRAVHGNVAKTKDSDHKVARVGLEICARALAAIADRGSLPSWEEWEHSGGDPHHPRS